MTEYHKIQTVFKRDQGTHRLIEGEYSVPELEYLADNEWDFTEKVDGTNIRLGFDWTGRRWIGGRTDAAQIPAPLLPALEHPTYEEIREVFPHDADRPMRNVILYGEGYGARIQKGGGNYRPDQGFVLFDVWVSAPENPGTPVDGWWLQRKDVEDVAVKLGLDIVPVIGYGTLHDLVAIVRGGPLRSCWGNFAAEGIVARPHTELRSRAGHRIITKLKARDFQP